jgi:hypothetical protein
VSKMIQKIDDEYHVSIPGVLLICAYEPTEKSITAIRKFLRVAKNNGWNGSIDMAETILLKEGASNEKFTSRAAVVANEIAKHITAEDVQEVLRD